MSDKHSTTHPAAQPQHPPGPAQRDVARQPAAPTAQHPADKRTDAERRPDAMRAAPSREEMEAAHAERLKSLDTPEQPVPTQADADAMKMGEYVPPTGTGEQARDLRPGQGGDYRTR